jgi:transglutaminase superfamily protein
MRSVLLQLRITALLAATRRSLRRRDTTATLRRFTHGAPWPSFDADDGLRAVRRASRLIGANCLAQSVALTVACARAGSDPELILGCRRYGDAKWGAHAWIILGAQVYDPLPSGEHQALASISAGTQWVPAPIGRV